MGQPGEREIGACCQSWPNPVCAWLDLLLLPGSLLAWPSLPRALAHAQRVWYCLLPGVVPPQDSRIWLDSVAGAASLPFTPIILVGASATTARQRRCLTLPPGKPACLPLCSRAPLLT